MTAAAGDVDIGTVAPDKTWWPDAGWLRKRWVGPVVVCLGALLLASPGLVNPSISYDEAITLMMLGGSSQPVWPQQIEPAGKLAEVFRGSPSPREIVQDLRVHDVHPPFYFVLAEGWSRVVGQSLSAIRGLSVLALILASLSFYGLLRWGRHPEPVLTSLMLACSSGVVIVGQAARPYGVALCLVCTAAWLAAMAVEPPVPDAEAEFTTERKRWFCSLGSGLCCGLAFLSNYLALFPIAVILLFLAVRSFKRSPLRALMIPALALVLWVPWAGFISLQSGARPAQNAGFGGWLFQLESLWRDHQMLLWAMQNPARPWGVATIFGIVFLAWLYLRRPADRALSWLLLGWALAPSVGLVAMNLAFDKHLAEPRYIVLAAPGIVGLFGYGLARIRWLWGLGVLFVLIQAVEVVDYNHRGTVPSQLAGFLAAAEPETTLVLVGGGYGHAFPAQVFYDLQPAISALVLNEERDLEVLDPEVNPFSQVWLLVPPEGPTRQLENRAFHRLMDTGKYKLAKANRAACLLVKVDGEGSGT